MSKRANSKRSSEERLTLHYDKRKDDIEDIYRFQFVENQPVVKVAAEVTEAPVAKLTPVVKVAPGQTEFKPKLVQDAHTIWETTLYEFLWASGVESQNADGSRNVCAGYRTLASHTGFGDKTIKRNLATLEQKLCIEPIAKEDSWNHVGKTYRIYSYRQIIERRESASLTWVIKNRQGVTLTTPPVVTVATGVRETPVAKQTAVATMGTRPVVTVNSGPVVSVTTQLDKEQRSNSKSSSSDAEALRALLRISGYDLDQLAIMRLLDGCRQNDPTCPLEQIAEAVREQWPRASRNPVGFVLGAVPPMFPRPARELRQQQEPEPSQEPTREYWEALADNPDATEAMKQAAHSELAKISSA